jgi:CBS domain-containing protein
MTETLEGRSVTDVMLAEPKTVPSTATVAEVRELIESPSVQMLLIADGDRFCGALTELPADADDSAPALDYADTQPESLTPSATAQEAFDRTAAHPDRRVVVLDDDKLVGLVCLDETRTRFCGRKSRG